MISKRRNWPVVITAALGIVVLCALGAWQVQRLSWKQDLLSQIEARSQFEPVSLAAALSATETEFLKVSVKGRYQPEASKLMIAVFNGSPGWEVVTPLVTADHLILVDRGLVPDAMRGQTLGGGEVEVTGVLRSHDSPRGFFSPDNDPVANQWYWWDVPAMLAATPGVPGVKAVPLVLHLAPTVGDLGFPRPQAVNAGLANNHLQYAITWFALAVALLVIAALYLRKSSA